VILEYYAIVAINFYQLKIEKNLFQKQSNIFSGKNSMFQKINRNKNNREEVLKKCL